VVRAVLTHHIETQLHKREGKAITNFQRTLLPPQSDLAEQTLKGKSKGQGKPSPYETRFDYIGN
jgi:hypothetical protein